ncbi:putative FLP FmtA-like protein, betalactamase [Polychaeton citri CBS 116435]|uniref:FLP FmtA-like protein, betalactamase n=1 Tax=Polychaeton citri CBS 116435 TaxID=1314669 RepID=A0A9P4UM56_9PEZI|nr:putative FLP FmtA-like protein, betalactamase [Polychaeton citri CBS 116435]
MRVVSSALPALWPLLLIPTAQAGCPEPSPAFPVPSWSTGAKDFKYALRSIEAQLANLVEDPKFNTSSYSVGLTSGAETLWSTHHTAPVRNESRPGAAKVDGDSYYRIASITKTFTTLAILQQAKAGNLSLDDPVDKYIPGLASKHSGSIPWKDITIRILASQLSGIPREIGQSDVRQNKEGWGLPSVDETSLPTICGGFESFTRSCTREDVVDNITDQEPLFAPNFKSTYSNVNFELLGLVIENVTGINYDDYITANIFEAVGMQHGATLDTPDDSRAVLPLGTGESPVYPYWDLDLGALKPTGGIYASSSAMSEYLRYILTHYNALTTGVNWLLPQSFAAAKTYYGMPWEIFRHPIPTKGNKREVTVVTKGGSLPGYSTLIALLPEYGLGLTMLTAGSPRLLIEIAETVIDALIPAVERTIWYDIDEKYTGTYKYQARNADDQPNLNTSLTLSTSLQTGLKLTSFISNSTDVMAKLLPPPPKDMPALTTHVQLVPTLLFKNETSQQGEKWRFITVPDEPNEKFSVLGEYCFTDDDVLSYAGRPLNEIIFWHETGEVELPAWRVTLTKVDGGSGSSRGAGLAVQDPRLDL